VSAEGGCGSGRRPSEATRLLVADWVLPISEAPVRRGAVAFQGEHILAVGTASELARRFPQAETEALEGILLPGLVNGHAHLEYTALRAPWTGKEFVEWIKDLVAAGEALSSEDWLASSQEGVAMMLATGCTAAADIVTRGPGLAAASEAGLRGISYLEVFGVGRGEEERAAAMIGEKLAAQGDRELGISPHAPYTISRAAIGALVDLAARKGVRLHVHLAESPAEVEFIARGAGGMASFGFARFAWDLPPGGAGTSPVAYAALTGVLGPRTTVAHGVQVDAADLRMLVQSAAAVACCPRSNAFLDAGEAPLADYLEAGVPLAIGTDSLASNSDLDLLAEARAWRSLARRQGAKEAAVIGAGAEASVGLEEKAVRLLTLEGAATMGWQDRIGSLEPGKMADLALVAVHAGDDPYRALIEEGAGRVSATYLAGDRVAAR